MVGTDLPGGVYIDPIPPTLGSEVSISYTGILAGDNQPDLLLCVGYGIKDEAFNQKEITMAKKDRSYTAQFRVDASDTLNFYFKDRQGNIDDQHGEKWQVAVDTENLSYA